MPVLAAGLVPVVGPALQAVLAAKLLGGDLVGRPNVPKAYGRRQVLPFPKGWPIPAWDEQGFRDAHGMILVIYGIRDQQIAQGCPVGKI